MIVALLPTTILLAGTINVGGSGDVITNRDLDRVCVVYSEAKEATVYDGRGKAVGMVSVPSADALDLEMNATGQLVRRSYGEASDWVRDETSQYDEGWHRLTIGPPGQESVVVLPGQRDSTFGRSWSGHELLFVNHSGGISSISWPRGKRTVVNPISLLAGIRVFIATFRSVSSDQLVGVVSVHPETRIKGLPVYGESPEPPGYYLGGVYYLATIDRVTGLTRPFAGFYGIDQRLYWRFPRHFTVFNRGRSVAFWHIDKLYIFSLAIPLVDQRPQRTRTTTHRLLEYSEYEAK